MKKKKPTIAELEKLLESEEDVALEILPNGEIRAGKKRLPKGARPITFKENLGGEYGWCGQCKTWHQPELLNLVGT